VTDDGSTRWILWSRSRDVSSSARSDRIPLWRLDRDDAEPDAEEDQPDRRPTLAAAVPEAPARQTPPHADRTAAPPKARYRRTHPGSRAVAAADQELVWQIVEERTVSIAFLPIRDASRGQVVGFEALSRGPEGPLHAPDRLFAAAMAAGAAGQLDWICRAEAFRLMLERQLPPALSLFVNVEPDSLIEPCPDDLLEIVWRATDQLRVFIDLTGRALGRYPFEVLEAVRRARAAGWGVAVSEVEFSASGVALLPALEPEVLKIDHKVLTMGSGFASSAVSAVLSEVEQTHAAVLVERIEDEAALRVSRCVGAAYQSGYLLGRPGPLPARVPVPAMPIPLFEVTQPHAGTPWDLLAAHSAHAASAVHDDEIDYLIRVFAVQAANVLQPPVVAVVVPDNPPMPKQTTMVFRMLLGRCPLVLILGRDVSSYIDWHARTADLPAGHPLLDQLCFVALSPTQAMALAARRSPLHDDAADFVITHNPTACREVLRYIIDTMDTLVGGVRHGARG
jgi:EAL domain-containing protein (putative c-di-GMP-specific phosphodiesterase class I)